VTETEKRERLHFVAMKFGGNHLGMPPQTRVGGLGNCYPIDEHFVITITSRCRMTRYASSQPPLWLGLSSLGPDGPLRNAGLA